MSIVGKVGCLVCGSFFVVSQGQLCRSCFDLVKTQYQKHLRQPLAGSPILKRSLFDWRPGPHNPITDLVHGLKGGWGAAAWKFWAKEFLLHQEKLGAEICNSTRVLVPIPSKTKRLNHSLHFAMALGELTGWPVLNGLRFEGTAKNLETKSLNRQERIEKSVKFTRTDPSRRLSADEIILVDDIITTGATLIAAHRALSIKNLKSEAWVLADRGSILRAGLPCDRSSGCEI